VQNLSFAAGGKEQRLAFENQIGIADGGIGAGDASPVGGAAKMGAGNLREGIALLNDDAGGRAKTRRDRGQENVGACHDVVGVNNGWICGNQIVPAKTFAQILLCELPERVTGLHCYYLQFRRARGGGTCRSGRLYWRNSNNGRGRLGRSYAKGGRRRRCGTNHWRCGLPWRHANGGSGGRHNCKVRRGSGRF
jgi:hypothetical protein